MLLAFALAGWAFALVATIAGAGIWRSLAERMELVARASHELRGPITAVRLGLQLGEMTAPRLRALDLELGRAGLALDDLARIGARRRGQDESGQVDVRQLLLDSIEAWRPAAAEHGGRLELSWTGPEALLRGCRPRLAQATGNLIANAIEHGGGDVEVRGRLDGDEVRVEVLDNGPGLPAPVTDLVGARQRSRGTRGRGLRIATAVAGDLGGRLASAPSEHGARLILTLPALEQVAAPTLRRGS
jgi:signal transduction histidine kinase